MSSEPTQPSSSESDASTTNTESLGSKLLKGTSLVCGYLALAVLLLILGMDTLNGFQLHQALRWEELGVTALALVIGGVLAWKKKAPWKIAALIAAMFLAFVCYAVFRFPSSSTTSATVFTKPLATLLNILAVVSVLSAFVGLWLQKSWPFAIKTVASVVLALALVPFAYGFLTDVGFEELILGVGFLSSIPAYYLQPAYLAIQGIFPLLVFLFAYFAIRNRKRNLGAALGLLSLVAFSVLFAGLLALHRDRAPYILSFWIRPSSLVGEALTTYVDQDKRPVSFRVATAEFPSKRLSEDAQFATIGVAYAGREEDRDVFNLSVKDDQGRDVLFLSKEDFELTANQTPQKDYGLEFTYKGNTRGQTFILVLDHSNSMADVIDELKLAAKTFVDLKRPSDKIVLIPFAGSVNPRPITSSTDEIKKEIDSIEIAPATSLYEAATTALEIASKQKEPTTIVVMTDGEPTDKTSQAEKGLQKALFATKSQIYSVGLGDPKHLDEKFLTWLSTEGKGKYYQVTEAHKLREIYSTIGAELQASYKLWYRKSLEAPRVAIISPTSGQQVAGDVELRAEVANASASELQSVDFVIDGSILSSQPYSGNTQFLATLKGDNYSSGHHRLEVIARANKDRTATAEVGFELLPAVEFRIVAPQNGDTVANELLVEADLIQRAKKELNNVRFTANGKQIATFVATSYRYAWDVSDEEAGDVEVEAIAEFADATVYRDKRRVTISRDVTMTFVSPRDQEELAPLTPLEVALTNESKKDPVSRIEFLCDEKPVGEVVVAPYTVNFDTKDIVPGEHDLRAIASLASGKQVSTSTRVKVSAGELVVDSALDDQPHGDTATFVFPPDNILVLLDASNSMWGQLAEGSKIDIAKQVLHRVLEMIPNQTRVGLRVYGDKSKVEAQNCTDSELLVPLAPLNKDIFKLQIASIRPRGKTPIAYSLEQAQKDLANVSGSSVVLLITDGIESCNGNPAEAAEKLHEQGLKTKVHVIGYDVNDPAHVTELVNLAKSGGGNYFPANGVDQLASAIVAAATIDYLVIDRWGREIAQGKVGSMPQKLRVGTYGILVNLEKPVHVTNAMVVPNKTSYWDIAKTGDDYTLTQRK